MENHEKRGLITAGVFAILGIISLFFDARIALFFKSIYNPIIAKFFLILDPLPVMLVLYLFLIFLVFRKSGVKKSLELSASLFFTLLITLILKLLIHRNRPFGLIETFPIINQIDYSFPSNHSSVVFSALPILDREFKKLRYLWMALAILIAFSRLYLQVHYLSDVILGAVIGYLIGFTILKASKRYLRI